MNFGLNDTVALMMKTVLVIEDELAIRQMLLEILDMEQFVGIEAENGLVGLKLAKVHHPDLIICDVMMPEMSGYDVLEALRKDPLTATIPFIFLTALDGKPDIRRGMNLGADDYLAKPFTHRDLMQSIASRLQKQEMFDQLAEQKLDDLRICMAQSFPHELNTPLNGLWSIAQYMRDSAETLAVDEIRELTSLMCKSAERLDHIIRNFLVYADLRMIATLPSRVNQLRNQSTPLAKELIEYRARDHASRFDRLSDLQFDVGEAVLQMQESLFIKVVLELVDNALKYSDSGSPIQITGTVNRTLFELSVTDYGRGMTESQIATIGAYMQFERKYYEQQGAGLGLSIVQAIAKLHGGDMKIVSTPNQQTTVQVTLPIAPALQ